MSDNDLAALDVEAPKIAAVRPDDEEQAVLDQELQNAKRELHALLVAEAYEKVKIGHSNLLEHTQNKTNQRDRIAGGKKLQENIAAAKLRVGLLDGLYENYQARYDAWAETAGIKDADDPQEQTNA